MMNLGQHREKVFDKWGSQWGESQAKDLACLLNDYDHLFCLRIVRKKLLLAAAVLFCHGRPGAESFLLLDSLLKTKQGLGLEMDLQPFGSKPVSQSSPQTSDLVMDFASHGPTPA